MYTIRKLFKFEMAHWLNSAYSRECLNIHGHSYKMEIIIKSISLNEDGMVIDFKKLKEIINQEIIDVLDHAIMIDGRSACKIQIGPTMKVVMVKFNPTAENMVKYIYDLLEPKLIPLIRGFISFEVLLHETDTGYASYSKINN